MKRHARQQGIMAALGIAGLILAAASATAQQRRAVRRDDAAVKTTGDRPTTTTTSAPSDKAIPLSFNNAPMPQIAKFLTDNLGKPALINKEVEKISITVVNPKPLPLSEALYVLRTALHEQGVAIEERERTLHLIPIGQIVQRRIQMVAPDADLTRIQPANQIIRKVFDIKHYDPTKLVEVLKPLMPSYGSILADPTTGKLILVATVEELITMSKIITELDQPEVSGRELRVFAIKNCDVFEIIPMLEKLIAGYLGAETKAPTVVGPPRPGPQPSGESGGGPSPGGGRSGPEGGPRPGGESGGRPPEKSLGVGVVTIQAEKRPVLLIPDVRRSSIVVEAPLHVLTQVEGWLKHLDQPKPPSTQTEIVEVQYGDAEDLCEQLTRMMGNIPDESLRSSLRIFPFPSSRRLMIVGAEQNRKIVKEWLKDIDVADTGLHVTQTFTLKHADAQQVADNIKELFGEEQSRSRYWSYYGSFSRRGGEADRTKVTVTANVRSNSVTVVASPERMIRITKQIEEWDKPFTGEEAAPRIFTLKFTDPEKTKELLESLFTKKEQSMRPWWWDDEGSSQTPSPVGRLFGQFRFEAYPETGKLIVVSKNEENYAVIEKMIHDIDQAQTAGLPRIIQLKFADAETLAEQLNALLNAAGTPTSILRRGRTTGTFKELADEGSPYSSQKNNPKPPQQQQQQQQQSDLTMMKFWWQNPPPDVKVKQPTNLAGKLRIVPNVEQNLLMVAAPEEYVDAIEKFVADLDKPGLQVLVKAVIAEITHDDSTSLGYRFSSDPSLFTSGDPIITENALRGLLTYQWKDQLDRNNVMTLNVDVNNLISLLRRVTDLKIKSEPKILTADNVEGEFFDGQDIPFISNSQTTDVGGLTQSFDYFPVGITLRVQPHITKEANVDLTVNLRVSSIVPGRTLFGGVVVDRRETTTRIVLENGKTFMISGILREEDRSIIRRIPGLGDIPGLGEAFKHREIAKVNSELLIFLTPYVIGEKYSRDEVESKPMERLRERMPSATEKTDLAPVTTQATEVVGPVYAADGHVSP